MKAFHFRLDQALRWRATQVDIEKSRAAAAAAQLVAVRLELEARRNELKSGARSLMGTSTGSALAGFAAWRERTMLRIESLEKTEQDAERAVAAQMQLLVEANRRCRLLENLRHTEHAQWQKEFGRELEAFASEAFLGRLQSKSGRARSSGG